MNDFLRDAFVQLHSRPLLQELKAEFEAHFPQLTFPDVPERVRMGGTSPPVPLTLAMSQHHVFCMSCYVSCQPFSAQHEQCDISKVL